MNKLKYLYTFVGTGAASLMFLPIAHASDVAPATITPVGTINTTNSSTTLSTLIGNTGQTIINVVLALATIIAIIYLIYAGVQYVTAGGDPEKAKKARGAIINSVIGIVVIVAAYAIINFALGFGNAASNTVNSSVNNSSISQ